MGEKRPWRFFRAGGFDQVQLDAGADLINLDALDQKLWVALACPTSGLELDPRTLSLIDLDKDGRVRASELLAAVRFAGANLKNPDELLKGQATLPLAAIQDGTPEGKTLLASARQILINIGKPDATEISAEDVADPVKIFAETRFNGDGVIIELSAEGDDATAAVIREILDCIGSDVDRSGKPGVGEEKVAAFFSEVEAQVAWYAKADADAARVLPLGLEKTTAAAAAVEAIRAKVDDYFVRCRLVGFDPRTVSLLNRTEQAYLDIAAADLSITAVEVVDFPLALVAAGRPLPLSGPVNPAHELALKTLAEVAVGPLLGPRAELTEADWKDLNARLAPFDAWRAETQGERVAKLGAARVREIGASGVKEKLAALIAKDRALEAEATSIESVERLVRYYRDLYLLCTNFVNFKDFYDGDEPATFQNGTLYLDRRACHLCMRVEDPAKHATMAGLAGAFLLYLDCARKATNEKMQIVAVVTAGDTGNLMVGRNGVFYDRRGRDWDATITKIIDSPISLRQAFWSPYRKFARLLEEQVAKRAAAAESQSHGHLSAVAATAVNVDKTKPLEPKKVDVGSVAALGVAVGAIGTFITASVGYATGLVKLGVLPTALAIVGVMLLISMPSVILAYIKLRKRNLGPILDANGWAVNADAKISVPFGRTLTSVAKLPPGSRRDSRDRYAEKELPWKRVLFLAVLLYLGWRWSRGAFDGILPERVQSKTVLGFLTPPPEAAPAAAPAPK